MPPSLTVAVPFVGGVTMLIVPVLGPSPPNVSLLKTGTVTLPSSGTVVSSASAVGTSFTELTVIVTVAVSHKTGKGTPLSQALYVKETTPLKFGFGVYVNVPSLFKTKVPFAVAVLPLSNVIVSGSPLGSLSLVVTSSLKT